MADKKIKLEDYFNLIHNTNNAKEQVADITQNLDSILQGTTTIAKGTANLVVNIVKTNTITKETIEKVLTNDVNEISFRPKHINTLTKMFVRDVLSISDFNKFNKVKKQGLKKAMKIAMAVILENTLGTNDKDLSTTTKGNLFINAKNMTKDIRAIWDSEFKGLIELTIKDASSYAEDVLEFEGNENSNSQLLTAFNNAFNLLEEKGDYKNLPADCRYMWSKWYNKIGDILQSFPKVKKDIKNVG